MILTNDIEEILKTHDYNLGMHIGAGNGELTPYIARHTKSLIAVDYFIDCIEMFHNNTQDLDNIIPLQLPFNLVPKAFRKNSVDFVVATVGKEVIKYHHLHETFKKLTSFIIFPSWLKTEFICVEENESWIKVLT